jgi:hypothetical protein
MQPDWTFKTRNFTITATCSDEPFPDLSWDEDGATAEMIDNGDAVAFSVAVRVYYRGVEIASDHLGECIYSSTGEFFTAHRDRDELNRNCEAMRAARGGNVVICHYFPSMVLEAVRAARTYFKDAPQLRAVA